MHAQKRSNSRIACLIALALVSLIPSVTRAVAYSDKDRIQPFAENPSVWQYKGKPVMLLGGSWQDNLFNHPKGLEQHLDLLQSVGGNYVRNVMSHRNLGNVFAYTQHNGKFDLDQWNDEYWRRFQNFLELTYQRDVIVQIEIWATWDHYEDHQSLGGWSKHPFNPANNSTYTSEQSGLPTVADYAPTERPTQHPFFSSVPALENNQLLLKYQTAFVDKLLSHSLQYPNVLYCMNNETGEALEWSDFWVRYVRNKAAEAGKSIETAEMRRNGNITAADHLHLIQHPDLYTFLDISQNNTQRGQVHWERIQQIRAQVAGNPRPLNNNKIYTFDPDDNIALERWWRNILGGCASARFHRPHPLEGEQDHEKSSDVGLGLSPLAQAHIRSARALLNELKWPDLTPDLAFVQLTGDTQQVAKTERTHLAYTRSADGQAALYVNGRQAAAAGIGGDLTAWDPQMQLALANELSGERPWLGTYHALAIYDRALNATDIAAHFLTGKARKSDGLLVSYLFDEGEGPRIHDRSGNPNPLDLQIQNLDAVHWREDGLQVHAPTLIATPAQRLSAAVKQSNEFTLELWVTPGAETQSGPARIVTMSLNTGSRNFTLGQDQNAFEMRLRTTTTSTNGLPAVRSGAAKDASIAAARSAQGDRAVVFVTHGATLKIDFTRLQSGMQARWLDPQTAQRQPAQPHPDGTFNPPTQGLWLLLLQKE